jgi:hypothetical protein
MFEFCAALFKYHGPQAWYFVAIPQDIYQEITKLPKSTVAFGSIPVRVCIGKSPWKTSLFPDKKSGTYLLPIKASIREKERLEDGDVVNLRLWV